MQIRSDFGQGLLVSLAFRYATSNIRDVSPFIWSEHWYPIITEWEKVAWV